MRAGVVVVLNEDDINNELKCSSEWILNILTHYYVFHS